MFFAAFKMLRFKKYFPEAEILAVDISPTAIEKAKEKHKKPGINFKTMDIIKKYKKISGKFDLIMILDVMWYILPHFEKIANYLMKNNLAPDGYLLIRQTFYPSGVQKYGNEIVSSAEDMLKLIKYTPVETIEVNRLTSPGITALFKKQ